MADQFTLQHGGSDQFLEQWGIVPQPAIPTPESTDNGKVLGVSGGQYALVSGGGGGGTVEPLIVTIDVPESGATVLDKTWSEIHEAFVAGIPVYAVQTVETEEYTSVSNYTCVSVFSEVSNDYGYYGVSFAEYMYTTDSEDGYPQSGGGDES